MGKFTSFSVDSAVASQVDYAVIGIHQQLKGLVRSANVLGTNAADFKFYPGTNRGRTTVSTAALINAVTLVVQATNNAGTQVNDYVIANDFVLVALDGPGLHKGWQLLDVTGTSANVGAGGVNGTNDLTVAAFEGGTGLDVASALGRVAYLTPANVVSTIDVDATSFELRLPFVGDAGHPFALSINEGAGGTTHRMSGVVEYVNN